MSIKHPKPKQIRLPFSVPRPGQSSKPQTKPCGICRKNDAKYVCPRCNLQYCSLECFRDQRHAQCSEDFYKSTVLDNIAQDDQVGVEEKKRMMEMLKRFEDGQLDDGDLLDDESGGGDEEDELVKALQGVDIDDIDSNQLFHLLPQAHRDAFLAALRDPESDVAKELLASAAAGESGGASAPTMLPWWERPDVLDEDDEDGDGVDYAEAPDMLSGDLLAGLKPPDGVGLKLVYNAVAICLAYLHTHLSMRLPSLDPARLSAQSIAAQDIKSEISGLVPFLVDSKSTLRYESVRDAYSAVWESIGATFDSTPSSGLLLRLLGLLPSFLHPPITTSPPSIFLVLSDLFSTFSHPKPGAAAPRKLLFYVAALQQLRREDWLRVEGEVRKEVRRLEEESGGDEALREEDEGDDRGLRVV